MEDKAYCTRRCRHFFDSTCNFLYFSKKGEQEPTHPGEECLHPDELKKQGLDLKLGLLEQNLVCTNSCELS